MVQKRKDDSSNGNGYKQRSIIPKDPKVIGLILAVLFGSTGGGAIVDRVLMPAEADQRITVVEERLDRYIELHKKDVEIANTKLTSELKSINGNLIKMSEDISDLKRYAYKNYSQNNNK